MPSYLNTGWIRPVWPWCGEDEGSVKTQRQSKLSKPQAAAFTARGANVKQERAGYGEITAKTRRKFPCGNLYPPRRV